MPLEGHYERQTTPMYKLSSRELRAAYGVLAVTLIALLGVILFTVGDSHPGPARGCIQTQVAGIVGSEGISGCGKEAVGICTRASEFTGARAETIVAECRSQGVRF
jgi:hypothetical protein